MLRTIKSNYQTETKDDYLISVYGNAAYFNSDTSNWLTIRLFTNSKWTRLDITDKRSSYRNNVDMNIIPISSRCLLLDYRWCFELTKPIYLDDDPYLDIQVNLPTFLSEVCPDYLNEWKQFYKNSDIFIIDQYAPIGHDSAILTCYNNAGGVYHLKPLSLDVHTDRPWTLFFSNYALVEKSGTHPSSDPNFNIKTMVVTGSIILTSPNLNRNIRNVYNTTLTEKKVNLTYYNTFLKTNKRRCY